MYGIAGLIAVAAGLLLQIKFLLLWGCLALVFEMHRYRVDLMSLHEKLSVLTHESILARETKRKPLRSQGLSSIGEQVFEEVDFLKRRLSTIAFELRSAGEQAVSSDAEVDEVSSFASEKEYCVHVLDSIIRRFRATGASILKRDRAEIEIFTRGMSGKRIERALESYFTPFFRDRSLDCFGVHDLLQSDRNSGDLLSLGIQYIVAFPVGGVVTNGTDESAVLCLGYSHLRLPSPDEIRRARLLSETLTLRLDTALKVKELYAGIKVEEGKNQVKDRYIANASHDIKTPLQNVRNILTLMKLEGLDAESEGLVDTALDNCDQMYDVLEDLLCFARYQLGKLEVCSQRVSLVSELERAINGFRASARIKGLSLRCGAVPDYAEVLVDPGHFRRILGNVLSNAIKYTRDGEISVGVRKAPGSWSVVISDTGQGMTVDETSRLFQPFTRFDTTGSDGAGLGLAIALALVEKNGGEIGVCSEPGKGSTFSLLFREAVQSGHGLDSVSEIKSYRVGIN